MSFTKINFLLYFLEFLVVIIYFAPFFKALGINVDPSLFLPFIVKKILSFLTNLESIDSP